MTVYINGTTGYTGPISSVGSISSSGNLTFTGTGAIISGDFSNATLLSRTMFQTTTANSSTGIYALPSGSSTAASWQATNAADPTNASKILIATNGSTDVQLVSGINGTGTYLPLSFYTSGAQKMQLDTAGNLGLGVTPSATRATWNQFSIGASLNITADKTGVGGANYFHNVYNTGSSYYLTNGPAEYYQMYNGEHVWYNAGSGTAGNAITFTQAMTLNASGNLLLGGTSTSGFISGRNLLMNSPAAQANKIVFTVNGGSEGFIYHASNELAIGAPSGQSINFQIAGSGTKASMDSSGRVTTPYQPAFFARYSNSGANISTGYLVWDSTATNVGGHYSTSTGRFTAPVAGVYFFSYQLQHKGDNSTSAYADLYINGSLYRGMRSENVGAANYQTTAASCVLTLAANDYVQIYNSAASGVYWSDHSAFSGYLLG